jgi:acetolactate synthase I/II/III large subunit
VMRALTERLTDDDLLVTDASLSSGWAASRWRTRSCGRRLLSPRGVAGLGWGLPAAAGAAFAIRDSRRPGRVVCLAGDGGWGYSLAEIETLARFSVPLTSIVLNNHALAWTKHGAVRLFPDAWISQDFTDVNWARAAESLGAWAVRVEDAGQLGDAIDTALSKIDGPSVLEVLSSEFETPVTENTSNPVQLQETRYW